MKRFDGFTVPEIGIVPHEFYDILPGIKTLTELKVTIVALRLALQFGLQEIPYSLEDFRAATGLDKSSVLRGIREGVKHKILKRIPFGKSFVYRVNFKNIEQPFGYHGDTPCMHDTLHATPSLQHTEQQETTRNSLESRIIGIGVATRVALNIIKRHDVAYLERHLEYTLHADKEKLARNKAAWFVASVRDNWGPPLGFKDKSKSLTHSKEFQIAAQHTARKYREEK